MANSPTQMLFANFNQDYTCVSVGTNKGYFITNCDPFGRVQTISDMPRGIVEMLFCTSLVALVGSTTPETPANSAGHSQRKLHIVNTKRKSLICELLFPSSILAVKLNRKTLIIVLEAEIYLYDISNMRLIHVIETTPNPDAICALSPSSENPYLAYPSPVPSPTSPAMVNGPKSPTSQSGDVVIFNTRTISVSNVVQAHKSPIASLSINSSGTLLATASSKGTVIRVWSIPGSEKLYQFRRGTREVHIWPQGGLCFNTASTLLACGSERGTVHIFKLGSAGGATAARKRQGSPAPSVDSTSTPIVDGGGGYEAFMDAQDAERKSKLGSFTKTSLALSKSFGAGVAGYLPGGLTEMWEPTRDFAHLRLPPSTNPNGATGQRCIVGMSGTTPHVYLVSSDGYFYSYTIDLENGGECVLGKQYSLLDSGDDTSGLDS